MHVKGDSFLGKMNRVCTSRQVPTQRMALRDPARSAMCNEHISDLRLWSVEE